MKKIKKSVKLLMLVATLFIAMMLVCAIYLIYSDNAEHKFYGNWEYNYTSTIDKENYTVEIIFFNNGSCFVNCSDSRFPPEYLNWGLMPQEDFRIINGERYYDVNKVYFDPWMGLPSEHDTHTQWGVVFKFAYCMFEDDHIVMVLYGRSPYCFQRV